MARPHKCTVDYYPHYCVHGKTMYIIEQRYGNDGYAFWFKLLERLGKTEGHFIDLSDDIDMEFIAAETRLSVGLTSEILDLLARLNAIDKSLWQESRIIWVQNFIDNIADAYKDRKVNLPTKPVNRTINSVNPKIKEDITPKSGGETHKLNKTILNTNAPPVFASQFFEVPQDLFDNLLVSYKGLTNERLFQEFNKMTDWLIDNAKSKKRLNAKGQIKNPRLFIRNWIEKIEIKPPNGNGKPSMCVNHPRIPAVITFMGQTLCDECHKDHLKLREKIKKDQEEREKACQNRT